MPKLLYDYTRLKKRMKDMRYTQTTLAREIPMDRQTLSTKLSHRSMFKQNEISEIARVLNIDAEEFGSYFFYSCCKERPTNVRGRRKER